jgi:putative ABC transport system permease protein
MIIFLTMFRAAIGSLLLHKLRSLLTVSGLVFGVASVIVMLAVAQGASEKVQSQIASLGVRNVIVRSVRPLDGDEFRSGSDRFLIDYGLKRDDCRRILETLPTVTAATPQREFNYEGRFGDQSLNVRLVGIEPEYFAANDLKIQRGRNLDAADARQFANVCVVGADVASKLFQHRDPLNRSIQIGNRQYFRIVGVAQWRTPSAGIGSSLSAQDYNSDVYIPLSTDHARIGTVLVKMEKGSFSQQVLELSQVTLTVDDLNNVKATATAVEGLLAQFHPKKDFAITIPLDLLEQARAAQRVFSIVLGCTAAISLLVGGIGIMNIMLATVSERTQEIGIRRALGAKQRDIVLQFMFETVLLSLVGAGIGLLLGLFAPGAVSWFSGLPTHILPVFPFVAVIVALGVGAMFGIYPAWRAAKLDPIDALRRA